MYGSEFLTCFVVEQIVDIQFDLSIVWFLLSKLLPRLVYPPSLASPYTPHTLPTHFTILGFLPPPVKVFV